MAKSFWQRGEDYAKKVSSEIIDQIKAGVCALAEAVETRRTAQRPKTSQPANSTPAAIGFT